MYEYDVIFCVVNRRKINIKIKAIKYKILSQVYLDSYAFMVAKRQRKKKMHFGFLIRWI